MKDIIKDIMQERFTKWEFLKYGIIYPCGLAEWLAKGGAL